MRPEEMHSIMDLLEDLTPKARYPKFNNEQEAMSHAARLAKLQPGDTLFVGNEGSDLFPVVFAHHVSGGPFILCLRVNPKNNDVESLSCPLTCVWFPDMITKD